MPQYSADSSSQGHKARTLFASLFGTLALWLIIASLVVVWLNRSLIDTPTFVGTVAPLSSQPAVQAYVAQTSTDQILQSVPTQVLANDLLTQSQIVGSTDDQLNALVQPIVYSSVLGVVKSAEFGILWKNTVRSAQMEMLHQLNANTGQLTLNLSPVVAGVLDELKQTSIAPVLSQIIVSPTSANIEFNASAYKNVEEYYRILKLSLLPILLLTFLATAMSIGISVDHAKTIRRILVGTGTSCLLLAVSLGAISLVKLSEGNQNQRAAAIAIAGTLFHNLQLAALFLGVLCMIGGICSKLYSRYKSQN